MMKAHTISDDFSDYIRNGIQERIQVSNQQLTNQGLLIWKLFVQLKGFEIQADEDDMTFSEVTPESVFCRHELAPTKTEPLIAPTVKDPVN